jgi:hypothetical protein
MSRLDHPLSEIHSGTHLVVVLDASILRDNDNLPVIAKDGSNGIKIRFNDNKLNHDKVFWTKSSDFKKLCKITSCDMTKPVLPQLKGKTIWMCIKEVKTMKEAVHVSSDYVAFDYIECTNPTQKPIISGDPCQHPKGLPLGVFVEYNERNIAAKHPLAQHPFIPKDVPSDAPTRAFSRKMEAEGYTQDVAMGVNQVTGEIVDKIVNGKIQTSKPKENKSLVDRMIPLQDELDKQELQFQQKLNLAKQIIAEGEGKKMTSLNEKNTPKEEQQKHDEISENNGKDVEADIFAQAESHGESNDNNHVEDDWSDL